MGQNTPGDEAATVPAKPVRTALGVLAICFALSVLGRGLGESFSVFLLPISESFGWDRAQVVSVYSLTALAGGLASPLIGRLFEYSGPRSVYSLGLLLLGGAFLFAANAHHLWQFQLSLGLCVGVGIAFIGNVPNSILLGRWFGPRLPTAMAVVYSATGAGVLILLPASQVLIDHVGWRGARPACAAVDIAVAAVLHRLAPPRQERDRRLRRRRLDAGKRDAPPRILGIVLHVFLHRDRHVCDCAASRGLSDRRGIPAFAGGDRLGFFRGRAAVRHARRLLARRHHRPQAVGAVQLRAVDRRTCPALAAAMVSERLDPDGFRRLLRQHDRLARTAPDRHRHEDISGKTRWNDLWLDFDRQRAGIGVRLLERRTDP